MSKSELNNPVQIKLRSKWINIDKKQALLITDDAEKSVILDVASSFSYELNQQEKIALENSKTQNDLLKQEGIENLRSLLSQGKLFGDDNRRVYSNNSDGHKLRLYEVVVQLSYGCNMACTYCYADKGEYGTGKATFMTEKTARDTVDFVFANRGSNTIGFGLLGGEPLINFNVLKEFILYARAKGERENVKTEFSVTTNGLLLNETVLQFLKKHGVSIRLSVDGTKEIHDKYRPDKSGHSTFDRVNNFGGKKMLESGIDHLVRASIFGDHGDQILNQVKTLFEDHNYRKVKVDFIWGEAGTPGIITETNLSSVLEGVDALGDWFFHKVVNGELNWKQLMPFAKYIGRLQSKPTVSAIYTKSGDDSVETAFGASILENNGVECGAGVNVISISYNGALHSCHRTEGNPEYKIGSIYSGVKTESLAYWSTHWRLDESDCKNCWARYVCIGGCPAFGVYKYNDPMKVDQMFCEVRRRFISWSIWINHHLIQKID